MTRMIALLALLATLSPPLLADEVRLTHEGLTLNANLEQVEGNWPAGPVVLLTHGTLAHAGMEIITGLQGMLRERGISSLAINLSLGIDDRHGMYDCKVPHRHRHTDAVTEIGLWRDWLKRQGAERIALLGHSRGGNQTARFAAGQADQAIVRVFLIAPQTWDEGREAAGYQKRYGKELTPILERARQLVAAGKGDTLLDPVDFVYCEQTGATAGAFASYYAADPEMDTPTLIPAIKAPVTVFAGSQDDVVAGLVEKVEPITDGERVRLQVIDGADHFFRDLYSEEIADLIAERLE